MYCNGLGLISESVCWACYMLKISISLFIITNFKLFQNRKPLQTKYLKVVPMNQISLDCVEGNVEPGEKEKMDGNKYS